MEEEEEEAKRTLREVKVAGLGWTGRARVCQGGAGV